MTQRMIDSHKARDHLLIYRPTLFVLTLSILKYCKMSFKAALTLVVLCTITGNSALLFHGDNIPGQTTTLGPLGKDATLSLLVKNVLDLEARVRSQEQEIQTLKNQKVSDDNVSANTLNKLMSKYIDMTTAFVLMKQEFNRNNNQTGLQTLKTRLDTIAQSVRYLTLSQQILHEEIQNFTNTKSADIYQLEALLSEQQANVTTMGSELLTLQNVMQSIQNSVEVLASKSLYFFVSNSGLSRV